jgi:polysaccharide biosynthesis transport protein
MELKTIINPLLRWWWLILASTAVAAISSFIATLPQPPIYQSQTTLIVGRAIADPNPTTGEFYLAEQLASTYAEIARREPVRDATMRALGLTSLPQYSAVAQPQSSIIRITVTDVNPLRAQAVANELARQLILQSPTAVDPEEEERQQFVTDQLARLQSQINQTQSEIERLQETLGNLTSARQIQDTQSQINSLQTVLNTLQSNYNGLLANTQRGAVNTLNVIETANRPTRPIGPNKPMTIMLASAIGLILAASAAYVIEFLDDTLKSPDEITQILGVPIIGRIGDFPENQRTWTYVNDSPRSPIADSFRVLRTNLDFANVSKMHKIILVSSADGGEGKSTIASNLAAIMAQSDRKVLLIDGDLRRPMLHNLVEKSNLRGLSDIFRERASTRDVITPTGDKNIALIASGPLPPNPTELLASPRMDQILAELRDYADFIIIDGPPFIVPDASVLADKVDGLILVVRPRYSKRGPVRAMSEQFQRINADVMGVVINGITRGMGEFESYYSGYGYGYHQHPKSKGEKLVNGREKSGVQRLAAMLKRNPRKKESL